MLLLLLFLVIIVDIILIYSGISGRGSPHEIQWINYLQDNLLIINIVTLFLIWSITTFLFFLRCIFYIKEFTDAVQVISINTKEKIELSKGIKPLEIQLNIICQNLENQKKLLKNSEESRRDLITHLAHDLKTPLTSIIGYLTIIKAKPTLDKTSKKKYVDIVLNKANKLNGMINELFEMTRFDHYQITLSKQPINLSVMVHQLFYEFKPVLKEGQSFSLDIQKDLVIVSDLTLMERILDNIVKNAINYGLPNSNISFHLEKNRENKIILAISNTCLPINHEQLQHVFEPFYRIDASRSSHDGGTGLGLYITKNFVEKLGGSITFQYEDNRANVQILFPQ